MVKEWLHQWCYVLIWHSCHQWFPCFSVQVEPNSIAARDGRIKEGDRILQASIFFSVTKVHLHQFMSWTHIATPLLSILNPEYATHHHIFSSARQIFIDICSLVRQTLRGLLNRWCLQTQTTVCIFNHHILPGKLKSLVVVRPGTTSSLALLFVLVLCSFSLRRNTYRVTDCG